ncbi:MULTISPECIES: thioredoxin family protein [Pseudomonas]|nr:MULTISPECIES: thioredoxin family protein [Pseudomonas]
MKPVFNELAEKLQSRAAFGKIDVAVSPTISQMHGVRSVPSLAIFYEGRLRLVLAGSRSAAALKKAVLADLKDVL